MLQLCLALLISKELIDILWQCFMLDNFLLTYSIIGFCHCNPMTRTRAPILMTYFYLSLS